MKRSKIIGKAVNDSFLFGTRAHSWYSYQKKDFVCFVSASVHVCVSHTSLGFLELGIMFFCMFNVWCLQNELTYILYVIVC